MAMQTKALTVSQITRFIKESLEERFFEIWVEGEVSDFRMPSSGHMYFILKDQSAQLRCVLFKGNQRYIRFRPANGMKVLVRGNITVYELRGEYQLICDYLEPIGAGALQIAFEQLKNRLAKEGLFDDERKRPIPLWPKRIGIVTSPTGAAIRDILNILNRRFPSVQVLINPVRVQGEGASEEISRAIKQLEEQPDIEVIILARGGGSIEDLWAFNEENVARAIYNSRVPVISAVGHEIDYTISDFAADLRAPTPSAAAELVIQKREQFQDNLTNLINRLQRIISSRTEMGQLQFQHLMNAKVFRDPFLSIRKYQEFLDDLEIRSFKGISQIVVNSKVKTMHLMELFNRLHPIEKVNLLGFQNVELCRRLINDINTTVKYKRQNLLNLMTSLNTLSPLNVLQRGYALCWRCSDEQLVKQEAQIDKGELVRLKFYKGGAICEVKEKMGHKETRREK